MDTLIVALLPSRVQGTILLTYDDERSNADPVLTAIETFRGHSSFPVVQGLIMDGIDRVNMELDPSTLKPSSPERLEYVLKVLDAQIEPTLAYVTDRRYHDAYERLIWGLARRAWQDLAYFVGIAPAPDNAQMQAINMHVRSWSREGLRRLAICEQAHSQASQPDQPKIEVPKTVEDQTEALILKREELLQQYKAVTNNPSNRQIYNAKNSGIHKPEFYDWRKGKLAETSATCQAFERFLRECKPPLRKPRS